MQVKLLRRAAGRLDSVVLHGSLRSTELGCRPLKGHRARMRELYAAEDRRRKRVRIEREKRRQRQEEARLKTSLKRAEAAFREGGFVETELFIALCGKYGIDIHPGRSTRCKDGLPIYPERKSIHYKGVSRGLRVARRCADTEN